MPRNLHPDPAIAAAGLLLLAPLLALIALAILIADGRPVLFRQARVGRGGRTFRILKFRSMKCGANGSRITGGGDRRVTRLGAFLRRYKLDELPQLWNVVRGEMDLVGPRPEAPDFVDAADPRWRAVLAVRPGVTDLATLLFRNEEELLAPHRDVERAYREVILPEKLALNCAYLVRRTWSRDAKLLTLTVWYSLAPRAFDPARVRRAFATELS